MGGFATEAYARKGWFSRLMTYVGSGKYGVGADSGVILVQDRRVRTLPSCRPFLPRPPRCQPPIPNGPAHSRMLSCAHRILQTGELEEENMASYVRMGIRVLYHYRLTAEGACPRIHAPPDRPGF